MESATVKHEKRVDVTHSFRKPVTPDEREAASKLQGRWHIDGTEQCLWLRRVETISFGHKRVRIPTVYGFND